MRKAHKAWHFLIFLAVFAGVIAIVMLLWNALIPSVIGWTAISYWQAAGFMILARLLLGGIGQLRNGMFFHSNKGSFRKMHNRMHNMSREDRRDFIRRRMAGFEECCGGSGEEKSEE